MAGHPLRLAAASGAALLLLAGLCAWQASGASPGRSSPSDLREQMRFGAEMAEKGNWREALFRWKKALEQQPDNPRLHNNLAVAFETLGDYEQAEREYQIAMKAGSRYKEIQTNHALFQNFFRSFRKSLRPQGQEERESGGPGPSGATAPAGPSAPEPEAPPAEGDGTTEAAQDADGTDAGDSE